MKGKYTEKVRRSIDIFWLENKFPPTLKDLMEMAGVPSKSHCWAIVGSLENVRLTRDGRPIPLWVEKLFSPKMFIVVADHPCYPDVYLYDTKEEAQSMRQEFIDDLAVEDGDYELTIYIAEVVSQDDLKSYF